MNKKMSRLILLLFYIVSTSALIVSVYNFFATPKLAYVKTSELIKGYKGMNEAKNLYNKKLDGWKSNLDTLKNQYMLTLKKYDSSKKSMTAAEKREIEMELRYQMENVQKYQAFIEENAEEEDGKLTDRVYGQINTYIVEYGKENNYDMIFGTNSSGSVMYGKDVKDVTKDVLVGLNQKYEGIN